MFKKLQSLLFEDEEDDIETEKAEATQPVPQPVQRPVQPVQPQPVVRPAEPVVAASAVQATAEKAELAAPEVKPVQPTSVEKTEEVKKTLGLTVDDITPEKKKTVKPAAIKPAVPEKKELKDDSANYQFRPVISPIFGVDEKDVNSLKNTTNKINKVKQMKKEQNVTPVLSPMYGLTAEETASVNEEDDTVATVGAKSTAAKEDEIPEFSLDDILKVRDQEFAEEDRAVKEEDVPDFPDLTFDDEDAPEPEEPNEMPEDMPVEPEEEKTQSVPAGDDSSIDNTVIIKQQLFDDDEN